MDSHGRRGRWFFHRSWTTIVFQGTEFRAAHGHQFQPRFCGRWSLPLQGIWLLNLRASGWWILLDSSWFDSYIIIQGFGFQLDSSSTVIAIVNHHLPFSTLTKIVFAELGLTLSYQLAVPRHSTILVISGSSWRHCRNSWVLTRKKAVTTHSFDQDVPSFKSLMPWNPFSPKVGTSDVSNPPSNVPHPNSSALKAFQWWSVSKMINVSHFRWPVSEPCWCSPYWWLHGSWSPDQVIWFPEKNINSLKW